MAPRRQWHLIALSAAACSQIFLTLRRYYGCGSLFRGVPTGLSRVEERERERERECFDIVADKCAARGRREKGPISSREPHAGLYVFIDLKRFSIFHLRPFFLIYSFTIIVVV